MLRATMPIESTYHELITSPLLLAALKGNNRKSRFA